MTPQEWQERKNQLREGLVRARESLSPALRREKSAAICRRIFSLEVFESARNVLVYQAVGGEVQLEELEVLQAVHPERPGKRWLFPVCLPNGEMLAVAPGDLNRNSSSWRRGPFQIPEPDPERGEILPPEEIDLVICPCVGVDERGVRLGMGGGFYDRFLPRLTGAVTLAAAFEVQWIPEIPALPWDHRVDGVITERRLAFFKESADSPGRVL